MPGFDMKYLSLFISWNILNIQGEKDISYKKPSTHWHTHTQKYVLSCCATKNQNKKERPYPKFQLPMLGLSFISPQNSQYGLDKPYQPN